jgi:hypothetical protein
MRLTLSEQMRLQPMQSSPSIYGCFTDGFATPVLQTRRGRPGPDTAYRKVTRRRFDIEWATDEETIAYDHRSDGMYPLIANDRALSPAQVLEAHKRQPMIEKRFEQIKTVHEIAPVFSKNEARIEALFTLYFLALLVQALIERELRLAMKREKIRQLPLYPEQCQCAHPSTSESASCRGHPCCPAACRRRRMPIEEAHAIACCKQWPAESLDALFPPMERAARHV